MCGAPHWTVAEELPYLKCPLHTVFKLIPKAYGQENMILIRQFTNVSFHSMWHRTLSSWRTGSRHTSAKAWGKHYTSIILWLYALGSCNRWLPSIGQRKKLLKHLYSNLSISENQKMYFRWQYYKYNVQMYHANLTLIYVSFAGSDQVIVSNSFLIWWCDSPDVSISIKCCLECCSLNLK